MYDHIRLIIIITPTACVYIRAKGLGQSVDQHCTGWRSVCGCGAIRKSPASGCGKSSQNLELETIVAVNGLPSGDGIQPARVYEELEQNTAGKLEFSGELEFTLAPL